VMANPVTACVIVFFSMLFLSQFLLEYYIQIEDAKEPYNRKF